MEPQQPDCHAILEDLAGATLFANTTGEFADICKQLVALEATIDLDLLVADDALRDLLGTCHKQAATARGAEDDATRDEAVAALQEGVQQLQDCLLNAPAAPAVTPPEPSPEGGFSLPEWVDETVFRDFISNHTDSIVDVEREIMEIEEGNGTALADLKRRVHTLKGEAGLIGLETLEHLCHAVEELLETPAHAGQAINQLLAFKDWVAEALVAYAVFQLPGTPPDSLIQQIEAIGSQPPAAAGEPEAVACPPAPAPPFVEAAHDWDADTVELIQEFLAEGEDGLSQVDEILLQAEDGSTDGEHVNAAFRVFHTIKGVAGFLELDEAGILAHAAESLLNRIREGKAALAGQNLNLMFSAATQLRLSLEALRHALEGGVLPRPVAGIPALIGDLAAATDDDGTTDGADPEAMFELLASEEAKAQSAPAPVAAPAPAPPTAPVAGNPAKRTEGKGTRLKEVVKIDLERVDNLVEIGRAHV